VSESGAALLFARYAYAPNALGLCGADAPQKLLEYGDVGDCDAGLADSLDPSGVDGTLQLCGPGATCMDAVEALAPF
jgi:hypothetical protein